MVSGKLGLRMTTLHEETSNAGNQVTTPVHDEDEEKSDADYSEYDSYQVVHVLKPGKYSLCITYIFRYIHDYYIRFSLKIWIDDRFLKIVYIDLTRRNINNFLLQFRICNFVNVN